MFSRKRFLVIVCRRVTPKNETEVIYQIRGRVFHRDTQTPRCRLTKRDEPINQLRGHWIPDETLAPSSV